MIIDNGVPLGVVMRELRIAESISRSLYQHAEHHAEHRTRLSMIDRMYSLAQRLGLLKTARNILSFLGLEQAARKMMKR